jgi:hypothetical protein
MAEKVPNFSRLLKQHIGSFKYIVTKYKFKRTIIVKELNAKGKPNVEFDNIKFEEAKIKKTKQGGLFDEL